MQNCTQNMQMYLIVAFKIYARGNFTIIWKYCRWGLDYTNSISNRDDPTSPENDISYALHSTSSDSGE